MSYRIHCGIVNKKELNANLNKINDDYNLFDFATDIVELHDRLRIEQFKPIKQFKDDEYPSYILTKNDFQKILTYYKILLFNAFSIKDASHEIISDYISGYFKTLIARDINISESGLFLLDYFYLVRMFENIKSTECFIITHG